MSTREDDLNELERLSREVLQLRDELERVTEERNAERRLHAATRDERDELLQELDSTKVVGCPRCDHEFEAPGGDKLLRELAETKAALEKQIAACKVHRDRASADAMQEAVDCDAAESELDQLRRAWALWALGWCDTFPESVAALIRAGAGLQIAECDECHQRAPVREVTIDGASACVCAWPCSEKGARDGE